MVTSTHTRVKPRGYYPDASVDPTDARKATVGYQVSAPIGPEPRAQGYRLREARTRRGSGVANRRPSAIDAGPIAEYAEQTRRHVFRPARAMFSRRLSEARLQEQQ